MTTKQHIARVRQEYDLVWPDLHPKRRVAKRRFARNFRAGMRFAKRGADYHGWAMAHAKLRRP